MPEEPETEQSDNQIDNADDQYTRPISLGLVVTAAGLFVAGLALLGMVAYLRVSEHSARIRFFTDSSLNLLILVAILVQAYIYVRQWAVMERTWLATGNAVKAAERMAELVSAGERAYVGVTGLALDDFTIGKNPVLKVTFSNAGKTPAFHFYCCPLLSFGSVKPEGPSYSCADVRDIEHSFIPAGKDRAVPYVINDLKVSHQMIEDMRSGTRLFATLLWLYIDFQGERRSTIDFIAVYDPESGTFTDCYDDYQSDTKPG